MRTRSKVFAATSQAHVPSAEDMVLINRLALTPLVPEEVYVRSVILCNGEVDRDFERFSRPVLEQFAQSIAGKALLIGHRHDSAPEGLFYKAEVIEIPSSVQRPTSNVQSPAFSDAAPEVAAGWVDDGRSILPAVKAYFYMVKTEDNEHLRRQIDGGILRYISIGFRCENLTCDLCQHSIYDPGCPHIPGREYEDPSTGSGQRRVCTATWEGPAEAVEGSIVFLGSQYGAEIVKRRRMIGLGAAKQASKQSPEPAEAEVDARIQALQALLRERDEEVARLRPLAEDGERLRAELIEEIQRLANLVQEGAVADVLIRSLRHADLEDIREVMETYRGRVEAKFPPRPHSRPAQSTVDRREIEPFAV